MAIGEKKLNRFSKWATANWKCRRNFPKFIDIFLRILSNWLPVFLSRFFFACGTINFFKLKKKNLVQYLFTMPIYRYLMNSVKETVLVLKLCSVLKYLQKNKGFYRLEMSVFFLEGGRGIKQWHSFVVVQRLCRGRWEIT